MSRPLGWKRWPLGQRIGLPFSEMALAKAKAKARVLSRTKYPYAKAWCFHPRETSKLTRADHTNDALRARMYSTLSRDREENPHSSGQGRAA
jgi:hypothetical protein